LTRESRIERNVGMELNNRALDKKENERDEVYHTEKLIIKKTGVSNSS